MKERIVGLYCIFALVLGGFELGHKLASAGTLSIGAILYTLACSAILVGIVWSKRDEADHSGINPDLPPAT